MLLSSLKESLKIIVDALPAEEVNWAVSGRTSLALQGIKIESDEVALLTSERCAYEIERRLRTYSIKYVEYVERPNASSHFGMLIVDNVNVEIIGGLELKTQDGKWLRPVDVVKNRHFVDYEGLKIPVTALEHEAGWLRASGDTDAAQLLESILHHKARA